LSRPVQISVIGGARHEDELLAQAEAVGRGIADAGAVLVCGGRTGVMEAAARGASQAGGTVLGILPSTDQADANRYVSHVIATGIGQARNLAVVASGHAVIAIGGEWGTLSELQSWPLRNRDGADLGIVEVETPDGAVAEALSAAGGS
jgi:uncharacterized protein (TIGR00725 family)